MSKSVLAQRIYGEMVSLNFDKAAIIEAFQTHPELLMTPQGATTYYYNCKRVAGGGAFNIPAGQSTPRSRDVVDNSPDKEDDRQLYTVVTPGDSECGKHIVVSETHSFYDAPSAFKAVKFDRFVVKGLPEIGENVDNLTPYTIDEVA